MGKTITSNDGFAQEFTDDELAYMPVANDVLRDQADGSDMPMYELNGATLKQVKTFVALRVAKPFGVIKSPLRSADLSKVMGDAAGEGHPGKEYLELMNGLLPKRAKGGGGSHPKVLFDLITAGNHLRFEDLMSFAACGIASYLMSFGDERAGLFSDEVKKYEALPAEEKKKMEEAIKWAEEDPGVIKELQEYKILPDPLPSSVAKASK